MPAAATALSPSNLGAGQSPPHGPGGCYRPTPIPGEGAARATCTTEPTAKKKKKKKKKKKNLGKSS